MTKNRWTWWPVFTFVVAVLAAMVTEQAAEASVLNRIREQVGAGTVLAMAPVDSSSGQTAILVLDTVAQHGLNCYAFPAKDRSKLYRKVEVGSNIRLYGILPGTVELGDSTCTVAVHWSSNRKGNPARRSFLEAPLARGLILAAYLAEKPGTIEAFDLEQDVARAAEVAENMVATFDQLGIPVALQKRTAPTLLAGLEQPADPCADCEKLLSQTIDQLRRREQQLVECDQQRSDASGFLSSALQLDEISETHHPKTYDLVLAAAQALN